MRPFFGTHENRSKYIYTISIPLYILGIIIMIYYLSIGSISGVFITLFVYLILAPQPLIALNESDKENSLYDSRFEYDIIKPIAGNPIAVLSGEHRFEGHGNIMPHMYVVTDAKPEDIDIVKGIVRQGEATDNRIKILNEDLLGPMIENRMFVNGTIIEDPRTKNLKIHRIHNNEDKSLVILGTKYQDLLSAFEGLKDYVFKVREEYLKRLNEEFNVAENAVTRAAFIKGKANVEFGEGTDRGLEEKRIESKSGGLKLFQDLFKRVDKLETKYQQLPE